jgi:hypothetical protein
MQLLIGLFGGLLAHSTYRRAATFSSSFTESRSAFTVWRSIVRVLETSALLMRCAMRPAPGGEPLYPVSSPGGKTGENKSRITRRRCQQAAPGNVPSVMFRLYVLYWVERTSPGKKNFLAPRFPALTPL